MLMMFPFFSKYEDINKEKVKVNINKKITFSCTSCPPTTAMTGQPSNFDWSTFPTLLTSTIPTDVTFRLTDHHDQVLLKISLVEVERITYFSGAGHLGGAQAHFRAAQ